MSVQTLVQVNGQWVTRTVDTQRIMAESSRRDAQDKEQRTSGATATQTVPRLGILSRTVFRSPIINFIIPARVRRKDKNDVILIGEDFIHVKEILSDGHLRHVTTKADFGARIRAARVFGEQRLPAMDARETSMDLDNSDMIPPQILVLTLESKELMFLFVHQEPSGALSFPSSVLPLPDQRSFLEQPGKHLAVDPRSRALAVAAVEESEEWSPIMQELPVKFDGVILAMEFLYPALNDENHVILLVVWAKDRRLRMTCWDWDHGKGLRTVHMSVNGHPLSSMRGQEVFPVLLIPLQRSSDFILVGEQDIYLYEGVLSGAPRCNKVLVHAIAPRYPGLSKKKPRWVCWARMVRNWRLHDRADENFYLAREDGAVYYTQFAENDIERTATLSKAGLLSCTVNTAFASLDVGSSLSNPDVLVAAGDMSQGQLVRIGSWQNEGSHAGRSREDALKFNYMESLPNWAPTTDFLVTANLGGDTTAAQRDSIFTTAGRAPHGAVCELRAGLEARIGFIFDSEELSSVASVWAFADAAERGVYFVMATPTQSLLIRIGEDETGDTVVDTAFDDTSCGLDFEHTTVTAASISNQYIMQATPCAVRVLDISSASLPQVAVQELSSDETLIAASVCRHLSAVFVAIRQGSEISLRSLRISDGPGGAALRKFGDAHLLSTEITCLAVFRIQDKSYVLVGLANGSVRLMSVDPIHGLEPESEHEISAPSSQSAPSICESAIVLQSAPVSGTCTDFLIVCSLRNGTLRTMGIELIKHEADSSYDLCFGRTDTVNLGFTSTRIVSDSSKVTSAFATCGNNFCRLDYTGGRTSGLLIRSIWFTDLNQPAFQQSPVAALSQIPYGEDLDRKNLTGALACICGSQFLVARLDDEPKVVPRRIPMSDATPSRIMYSSRLEKIVTGSLQTHSPVVSPEDITSVKAQLQFVDGEKVLKTTPLAERVYAMLDWTYEDAQGRKYGFLLLGLGNLEGSWGRVTFLSARPEGNNVNVYEKFHLEFDKPVLAIALYDQTKLVIAVGSDLRLYSFDAEAKRWHSIASLELPSSATHVTTSAPYIYASTLEHSFMAFELRTDADDQLSEYTIEPVLNDSQIRETWHHLSLTLPDASPNTANASVQEDSIASSSLARQHPNLFLVSDKSCTLVGIYRLPNQTQQNAAPMLFEARLPRSIARLRQGHVRPPWCSIENVRGIIHQLGGDILGCAADGTLMSFVLLDMKAWRLIKAIENVARVGWHTDNNGLSGIDNAGTSFRRSTDLCPEHDAAGLRQRTAYHVDGDLLEQQLDKLRGLVENLETIEETRGELRRNLTSLANDALGDSDGDEDALERIVGWVKQVLKPVL
ncbi:hypothetical protein H2199_007692 [Coniosporium tulheliwenetii]|uniref:Uncharacterized protein n=1 Tax=Coniosporium tulheliwenetii TaxID=3383036 RepID=A0ACC2YNI0_9PEZI|nr:hypothetical protein H2199_007692 [Cladosporium sp. JES 115]